MQHKENKKEVLCINRITKKRILDLCRKDKLYQTPELNDVLYLHYQGFDCIECLDEYTGLKCLWLESNAFSEIKGLDKQTKLKCLFLQSNLIRKIENLDYCKELDTLNLSQNHIRKIENCGSEILPVLNTLNLASNYLKDWEGLKELENCKTLSVLDVSNNRIDDILVVKIFAQMPELKVLVLQGNPVVSKIPQYRKTLILECKKLTYLDSRPVFPKDRACAEAWKRGGYEEERKENERWNRKERKKMRDSVNATINLRNKHREQVDKIPLIQSSDSEDDIKPEKGSANIRIDSEGSMNNIWDEVTTDKNSISSLICNTGIKNEASKLTESGGDEGIVDLMVDDKENIQLKQDKLQLAILEKNSNHSKSDENRDFQKKNSSELLFTKPIENRATDRKEETMNIVSEEIISNDATCKIATQVKKIFSEETVEQGYCESNTQFKTTNVKIFANGIQGEQEKELDIRSQEPFCKEISKESVCWCSDNDKTEKLEKLEFKRVTESWNKETKLQKENNERTIKDQEITSNTTEPGIDKNNTTPNAAPGKIFEHTDKGVIASLDISVVMRESNEALISLESESKKLKLLLQELEKNNEKFLKDTNFEENSERKNENCKYQKENEEPDLTGKENNGGGYEEERKENERWNRIHEQVLNENISGSFKEIKSDHCYYVQEDKILKKITTEDVKDKQQIVEKILQEILQSCCAENQEKSHEFPNNLTEKNREFNLKFPANISKSMPDIVESFNNFFSKVNKNQRTRNKTYSEKIKSELNRGTLQSLHNQLEELKGHQHKDASGNVDRLYEQKGRYDDTLESVDGRLMEHNHDTNEKRELLDPSQLQTTCSDDEYATAQSEEEVVNIDENLRNKQFKKKVFQHTARKSSENLIIKALDENKISKGNDDSDDSNDDFYSLDYQEKPNLCNIDREFITKLALDLPNLTQIDKNHVVHCTKSYEEMKQYVSLNKERSFLTAEEQELMENMNKRKCIRMNKNTKTLQECLQHNNDLSKQEPLWVSKIIRKAEEMKAQENTCNADQLKKTDFKRSSDEIFTKICVKDILQTAKGNENEVIKNPEAEDAPEQMQFSKEF